MTLTPLQQDIYARLKELGISFGKLICEEPAVTIEQCRVVEQALGVPVIKTLFVANRQLTRFHLVVMPAGKPFVTRDFSRAMGVSRVSFVPADLLDKMLQTQVGGCSPLCAQADREGIVQVVIDAELKDVEEVACPDSTPDCYLALKMRDIVERFLPSTAHEPVIAQMNPTDGC